MVGGEKLEDLHRVLIMLVVVSVLIATGMLVVIDVSRGILL